MVEPRPFTRISEEALRRRMTVEYEVSTIITREVSDKREVFTDCVVVNSLGIRPYVPVTRPFDDLDMVFPDHVSFDEILHIAEDFAGHAGIERMPEPNMSLHIKYSKPRIREIGLTGGFSIHLHSGGVWYENRFFHLDRIFFNTKHWVEVPAVSEVLAVLPVPKLEELFLLKLHKFLGFDRIDILSMLYLQNINIPYIVERARKLEIVDGITVNLEDIKQNYDILKNEWVLEHLLSMSRKTENRIMANLDGLLGYLRCR